MEVLKEKRARDEVGKKIAIARSQRIVQASHAKRALKPKVEKEKMPSYNVQHHKKHKVIFLFRNIYIYINLRV